MRNLRWFIYANAILSPWRQKQSPGAGVFALLSHRNGPNTLSSWREAQAIVEYIYACRRRKTAHLPPTCYITKLLMYVLACHKLHRPVCEEIIAGVRGCFLFHFFPFLFPDPHAGTLVTGNAAVQCKHLLL